MRGGALVCCVRDSRKGMGGGDLAWALGTHRGPGRARVHRIPCTERSGHVCRMCGHVRGVPLSERHGRDRGSLGSDEINVNLRKNFRNSIEKQLTSLLNYFLEFD